MNVGMLVRRVYVTYCGDIQIEDLTHECENAGVEGARYL